MARIWNGKNSLNLISNRMAKQKLVVFTGAGISAESGISTFRDTGGLWRQYDVEDLATVEAWHDHPKRVIDFYNDRLQAVRKTKPNAAHQAISKLEKYFDVQVITQNVDDLHERAGSNKVLHLHGEINKVRSSQHPTQIYPAPIHGISIGDLCPHGSQLRPHVVFFGEEVPAIEPAKAWVQAADYFVVVGTSLKVYPAALLFRHASAKCLKFLVDPGEVRLKDVEHVKVIRKPATVGVVELVEILKKERAKRRLKPR